MCGYTSFSAPTPLQEVPSCFVVVWPMLPSCVPGHVWLHKPAPLQEVPSCLCCVFLWGFFFHLGVVGSALRPHGCTRDLCSRAACAALVRAAAVRALRGCVHTKTPNAAPVLFHASLSAISIRDLLNLFLLTLVCMHRFPLPRATPCVVYGSLQQGIAAALAQEPASFYEGVVKVFEENFHLLAATLTKLGLQVCAVDGQAGGYFLVANVKSTGMTGMEYVAP